MYRYEIIYKFNKYKYVNRDKIMLLNSSYLILLSKSFI